MLVALLAVPALALALAVGKDETLEPKSAAMTWLNKTDAGDHAGAWSSTAAGFKNAVTLTQWQQAVQGVRAPLGPVRARKDQATTLTRTLPGAPDGRYAVIQFETVFANKAQAVETVTTVQETDGIWRVTGYFVR